MPWTRTSARRVQRHGASHQLHARASAFVKALKLFDAACLVQVVCVTYTVAIPEGRDFFGVFRNRVENLRLHYRHRAVFGKLQCGEQQTKRGGGARFGLDDPLHENLDACGEVPAHCGDDVFRKVLKKRLAHRGEFS